MKIYLIRHAQVESNFKNTSISLFEIKNNKIKAAIINDSTHLDDTSKDKRVLG